MSDHLSNIHARVQRAFLTFEQAVANGQPAGSPALPPTTNRLNTSPGSKYRPWDHSDLLQRLHTYKPATWFAKPKELGAPVCALQGWVNCANDLLKCECCGAKLHITIPPNLPSNIKQASVDKHVQRLASAHLADCPWQRLSCEPCLLDFPQAPLTDLLADYAKRAEAIEQLDALPKLSTTAVDKVLQQQPAVSAMLDAQPAALAAGQIPEQVAQQATAAPSGAPAAGTSAAGRSPAAGAAGAAASPGAAAAAASNAGLSRQQACRLLALLGWQLQELSLPAAVHEHLGSSSSYTLGHLVQANRPKSAGGAAAAAAAAAEEAPGRGKSSVQCLLHCQMCGAQLGLWNFSKKGPLYLHSKVLSAAAAAVAQAGVAGQAEQGAAAALQLQTIAGGSLLGPRASAGGAAPAAPAFAFGATAFGSGQPAFGIHAVGLPGKRKAGDTLDAGPAKQARAGAGASPAAAAAAAGTLGSPSAAAGARPAGAQRAAAAATAAGGAPSAVASGAQVPAGTDSSTLDPVGSHRAWCPWVASASAELAAAAGGQASSSSTRLCGWRYIMSELARHAGPGQAQQAGGPAEGPTGSEVDERVRRALGRLARK